MNLTKRTLTLITALLMCLALAFAGSGPILAAVWAETDYYAPITATKGDELLGQLHDLITTTHTHYSTYGDCRDYATETDPALNGESGIVEFYTHETIVEYTKTGGDAGRWNREHVWPKKCSNGLWGTDGGGADLHHIRPSEVKMNGTRGDSKFGEVTNGGAIYSKTTSGADSQLGGHHAGGVFEPLDNVKGDAARIVMYLYVHYNRAENVHGTTNGNGQSSYFGTLHFTDIMAGTEEEAIELLLKWNELDPVDDIEKTRNEVAFGVQGNRNPFIDHPEYADMVWAPPVDPDPTPVDPDPTPVDPDPTPGGSENPGSGENPGSSETPGSGENSSGEGSGTQQPSAPAKDKEPDNSLLIGCIAGAVCVLLLAAGVIVAVVAVRRMKK